MRDTLYNTAPLFNIDHIKKLNKTISEHFVQGSDKPKTDAIKTSQVKFVNLGAIQHLISPFLDFIIHSNTYYYGFDIFQLTGSKKLNYNTYQKDEEYTWHIDATVRSPIRDMKLTCLLNCSDNDYKGGDLFLFRDKDVKVENFGPGSAVVFPSFISHKVEKIISGSRATLAIWMNGPKFR
tara:strand:+ start:4719 stop:5258 length:540 start_codon:yes stop_codon:yes gene_type:complete